MHMTRMYIKIAAHKEFIPTRAARAVQDKALAFLILSSAEFFDVLATFSICGLPLISALPLIAIANEPLILCLTVTFPFHPNVATTDA